MFPRVQTNALGVKKNPRTFTSLSSPGAWRILVSTREIRYDSDMSGLARKDILSLSIAERIELVADIWDSIAEVPEAVALTDAQKAELDRRLDAYRQDPTAGAPWSVVRERITRRK